MRNQIILFAACAGLGWGQGPGVMLPPTLGYYFDASAQGIRTLSGVPGAAIPDASLSLTSALKNAWVSPNRTVALAESKDTSQLLVVSWGDSDPSVAELPGAPGGPDLVAFSPGGDNAVAYYKASATVRVWLNLTEDPAAGPQFDVGALNSPVSAVAISDDGNAVAVAAGSVLLLSAHGPRTIAPNGASALAFAPGSHDLALADAAADQVSLVHDVLGDAGMSVLADAGAGIAQPGALAFSADGLRLAVGNLRTKSVELVDAAGAGVLAMAACPCTPNQLLRTRGNAVFLAGVTPEGALTLFDGDSGAPSVSAIPAGVGGGN